MINARHPLYQSGTANFFMITKRICHPQQQRQSDEDVCFSVTMWWNVSMICNLGAAFIRQQWFFIKDWHVLDNKIQKKWLCVFKPQSNGFDIDRYVFVFGGMPFCACCWDGTHYTWMSIEDGSIVNIPDTAWSQHQVHQFVAY